MSVYKRLLWVLSRPRLPVSCPVGGGAGLDGYPPMDGLCDTEYAISALWQPQLHGL